jgi:ABC-type Mn2+/Zn2+ transport system ATPase subunit
MDNAAIRTHGLRKLYGTKVAVADLTLVVPRGEVFGFLGPNGAGKSTAVKMLLGLVKPNGGEASVLGHPPGAQQAMGTIGFLPEHFRFHEWLHAEELLDLHGRLYGMHRLARRRRIPQVLELVGLAGQARRPIAGFSKGMLQRIGLAQALLNEPTLVFLDEPTSALDLDTGGDAPLDLDQWHYPVHALWPGLYRLLGRAARLGLPVRGRRASRDHNQPQYACREHLATRRAAGRQSAQTPACPHLRRARLQLGRSCRCW